MKPPRRILIGAASFADARAALRLARHLVAQSQTEVAGLLVEETSIEGLPRLARQRVVTSSGALRDVPTAREAARMIEGDIKAFRAALAELPGPPGPVERRRGDLTVATWEVAHRWDILVCGQRETHRLPGRIILIAPPAGAAPDAAELAQDLARAAGSTTVTLGLAPNQGPGAEEIYPDERALFDRIGRLNCAAVVLDRAAGPIRRPDQLRALLAAAHCPVVLVGATTETPASPG